MITKRLSKGASKEDRLKAHLVKMGAKEIVRNRQYEQMKGDVYCLANLSVNHPDYGMSPQEHYEAKIQRESEKSS